jgi:hypothetical protein
MLLVSSQATAPGETIVVRILDCDQGGVGLRVFATPAIG